MKTVRATLELNDLFPGKIVQIQGTEPSDRLVVYVEDIFKIELSFQSLQKLSERFGTMNITVEADASYEGERIYWYEILIQDITNLDYLKKVLEG